MTFTPEYPSLGKFTGEPSTPNELAQHQIARSVNSILDDLDDLIELAADNDRPEVQALVCSEQIKIGMALSRVQLLLSFIESRRTSKLRMISNA